MPSERATSKLPKNHKFVEFRLKLQSPEPTLIVLSMQAYNNIIVIMIIMFTKFAVTVVLHVYH